MLDDIYLEKIEKYIGKKVTIKDNDNKVSIYADAEIQYYLCNDGKQYIFYIKERGIEKELDTFQTETEMRRMLSLWLKGIFAEKIQYPNIHNFENIESIPLLKSLMNENSNKDFFSINEGKEDKINLSRNRDGSYDIFFLDKFGKKYVIEEKGIPPVVFERFYKEVIFYENMIKRINEYEIIYQDILEYNVKMSILGYKQNVI